MINKKIKGSILGGAIGDALGYPVEFWSEDQLFRKYGEEGITEYTIDYSTNKALVSDDTQMTLFTIDGLTTSEDVNIHNIFNCYKNWLYTQEYSYEYYLRSGNPPKSPSQLNNVPELYARRAPGRTCLTALKALNSIGDVPINKPINDSKGCGGVMRIAPVGLINTPHIDQISLFGANVAAITHGHPLGFIPAAFVVSLINKIVYSSSDLKTAIKESLNVVEKIFKKDFRKHVKYFNKLLSRAVKLSENSDTDINNIHRLGRGNVAEETVAIAIYCALRYSDNFSAGIIAAVNHGGDSDSVGSVAGNILGAKIGFDEIEEKWKNNLELYDIILKMAEKLYTKYNRKEY